MVNLKKSDDFINTKYKRSLKFAIFNKILLVHFEKSDDIIMFWPPPPPTIINHHHFTTPSPLWRDDLIYGRLTKKHVKRHVDKSIVVHYLIHNPERKCKKQRAWQTKAFCWLWRLGGYLRRLHLISWTPHCTSETSVSEL